MDTPSFNTKVECPLCGTVNEFETIRVGAYVETGRDTDFCPVGVKWRFDEYRGYNPLVFFVATCPKCYYSREFNDAFKGWKSNSTFKTYRLKRIKTLHLEDLARDNSIIKRLGQSIDLDKSPNESAIAKLLLTIRDETLNERPSNLDLGRFYLRIAWVMRQLDADGPPQRSSAAEPLSAIDQKFQVWSEGLTSLTGYRDELFGELNRSLADGDRGAGSEQSKIESSYAEIKEQLLAHEEKCRSLGDELSGTIKSHRAIVGRPAVGRPEAPFGGKGSLYEFLTDLKRDWPETPLDEREALNRAVEGYQKALEAGKEVSAGNLQIQVCYLIAELSRRAGEFTKAREFFNSVIKVGQEYVREHQADKSRTALARKILDLAAEQTQAAKEEAAGVTT